LAYLTIRDRQLLKYPPTETTWVCKKCETPLSGTTEKCWLCGANKPLRGVTLLYPDYLAACAKAKHEPGVRWPMKVQGAGGEDSISQKPVRRKRG
jgi:hypothetical protein